jgi:hypothetical protein
MASRSRTIGASVAAVLVVVGVVAVILVFGLVPAPEFPTLAEQPDPAIPGTIAYVEQDACIFTVPASGGLPNEVTCGDEFSYGSVDWTADGLLVVESFGMTPALQVLDPRTGEIIDEVYLGLGEEPPASPMAAAFERTERADGARIRTRAKSDGSAEVITVSAEGTRRTLLAVEDAPRDYRFYGEQWSPDGNWVSVWDSEGRLIILRASGDADPRVLVEVAGSFARSAWFIPGDATYTVDLPER